MDYWDYLGWRDTNAHRPHAKRQSMYTKQQHRCIVYTPAVCINGKAWRSGWYNRRLPDNANSTGVLKGSIDGKQLKASYSLIYLMAES